MRVRACARALVVCRKLDGEVDLDQQAQEYINMVFRMYREIEEYDHMILLCGHLYDFFPDSGWETLRYYEALAYNQVGGDKNLAR